MASIVQHLIPESQTPETLVTASEEMSLQDALERMIEYDFSQLPVVDNEFKLKGLVTSDSILKTVSYFKNTLEKIAVSHAAFKPKTCRPDDDLSELLNGLRDASAIPIVDKSGNLVAIVTNYDTAEYYRQRAEDIMVAEDVETTLRDYIEFAYKDNEGNVDKDALRRAIEAITPSGTDFRNKFKQALCGYLGRSGQIPPQPDQPLIDTMFIQHLHQPIEIRAFEDLTLFEYIQLFKNLWERYKAAFNHLEWDSIFRLLDEVRQTRNAIAHFREVTANQGKQLRYCASFLERHRPTFEVVSESGVIATVIDEADPMIPTNTSSDHQPLDNSENYFAPIEEELGPNESRYAPLALWLQKQVEDGLDRVVLTFEQVEKIIEDKLPPTARQHRTWWANDSVGHTQSQQWLDVGWRVSNVNISEERVIFSQIDGRQRTYIEFFNTLLPKVKAIQSLQVEPAMNPQGRHWFTFKITSEEVQAPTWITFSFARKARFRVELYIETGDRTVNKQLFDKMYSQKADIEAEMGEPLSWERLNVKRGSRIALYRNGASITSSSEKLINLQDQTIETMIRFYEAVAKRFQDAKREVIPVS